MKSYTQIGTIRGVILEVPTYECKVCGDLTTNPIRHSKYHHGTIAQKGVDY